MSPVIPSLRKVRRRGAALVEFALVFPLLFLVIASVWEWSGFLREANVLIEATRHGARVIGGISATPAGGGWCDPTILNYDTDWLSCTAPTPSAGPLTPVQGTSVRTSLMSVCQYLEVARVERARWQVRLQLETAYPFLGEVMGLDGRAFRIQVRRDPGLSRPCIVCLFGFLSANLQNEGSSVFPMQSRCS